MKGRGWNAKGAKGRERRERDCKAGKVESPEDLHELSRGFNPDDCRRLVNCRMRMNPHAGKSPTLLPPSAEYILEDPGPRGIVAARLSESDAWTTVCPYCYPSARAEHFGLDSLNIQVE